MPVNGDELDIDESLALAVIYSVLGDFGVSSYQNKAKDLISDYQNTKSQKINLIIFFS